MQPTQDRSFEQEAQTYEQMSSQPIQETQASYEQQGYDVSCQYDQQSSDTQQAYQYQQPQQPYQQNVNVNVQPTPVVQQAGRPVYFVSEQDKTLRLIAFIFMLISLIGTCWLIVPLAWMIPMIVISWGIYKGTKPNSTAFGVCTLLFVSIVAGILLLISTKEK